MDWYQIASLLLPIVSIIAGYFIRKYYKFSSNVKGILKETIDVVMTVDEAMRDDKIEPEEIKKLIKEIKDLYYVIHGMTVEEVIIKNGGKL